MFLLIYFTYRKHVLWQYCLNSESELPDMATTYAGDLNDEKQSVLFNSRQWRDFSWEKCCYSVQKQSLVSCTLLEFISVDDEYWWQREDLCLKF